MLADGLFGSPAPPSAARWFDEIVLSKRKVIKQKQGKPNFPHLAFSIFFFSFSISNFTGFVKCCIWGLKISQSQRFKQS